MYALGLSEVFTLLEEDGIETLRIGQEYLRFLEKMLVSLSQVPSNGRTPKVPVSRTALPYFSVNSPCHATLFFGSKNVSKLPASSEFAGGPGKVLSEAYF